jgi:hypothetical protein
MHTHLHFASLYGALPKNWSIDAQLQQMLIPAFASEWQNFKLFFKNWLILHLVADLIDSSVGGQSSWLHIQRSGFDSRHYQIFWEVVGLQLGPLSHVSTIEELLERESSSSSLENRDYSHRDPPRWPRGTFYPQKLPLTSLTSGVTRHSSLATQATEFRSNKFILQDNSYISLILQTWCHRHNTDWLCMR